MEIFDIIRSKNTFTTFDLGFYKNKKVLVTGHTGFKGSWMCRMLKLLGAEVYGYALNPPTDPSLFKIAVVDKDKSVTTQIGDIRDLKLLKDFFMVVHPEIVIHMAAQPIVRDSYTCIGLITCVQNDTKF